MIEFSAFLLPTDLGKPKHSQSAPTELPYLSLAEAFLHNPVNYIVWTKKILPYLSGQARHPSPVCSPPLDINTSSAALGVQFNIHLAFRLGFRDNFRDNFSTRELLGPKWMFAERDKHYPTKPVTKVYFGPITFAKRTRNLATEAYEPHNILSKYSYFGFIT